MKAEVQLALWEAVEDSMGVYPASVNGVPRTPWQDGYNAFGEEFLDKRIKVIDLFALMPEWKQVMIGELLIAEAVNLRVEGSELLLAFNASDLFAWGYSCFETITDDDMLKTLHAIHKQFGEDGMRAWWCKHENEKPQWPIEKRWRESGLWDAELEALPECKYDEKIGRWTNKAKADAIKEITSQPTS